MKVELKPPITYYGGKQNLLKEILPLIPNHKCYCEPFFGGGAVFFAKPRSKVEVINDFDDDLVVFYRQIKSNFKKLNDKIELTLHSRKAKIEAVEILKDKFNCSELERAWALWVIINQGFAKTKGLNYNWIFSASANQATTIDTKRKEFKMYQKRLEKTSIECWDVLKVIKNWDSPDTFFYCDPPYVSSDCGRYITYTEKQFEKLLLALTNIEGKFLLSSYPEKQVDKYREKFNWNSKDIKQKVTTSKAIAGKEKTECLSWNYDIQENQLTFKGM